MLSEVQIFQLQKKVEPTLCGEKVPKSQNIKNHCRWGQKSPMPRCSPIYSAIDSLTPERPPVTSDTKISVV